MNLAQDIQPVTALPASLPEHALVFTAGDVGVVPVEASPGSPGGGDLGSGLSGAQSITDLDALLGPDNNNDDDVQSPESGATASKLALGNTVHGIALKLRMSDLPKVDSFVSSRMGSVQLVRTMVRVELYDGAIFGTEVDCWTHVAVPSTSPSEEKLDSSSDDRAKASEGAVDNIRPSAVDTRSTSRVANEMPDARLIETMVQGCVQLGVKSAYVDRVLRAVPSRPRPIDTGTVYTLPLSTHASNKVGGKAISDLPSWSESDVLKAAADHVTSGFVTCLNGRVLLCRRGDQHKEEGLEGGVLTEGAVAKLWEVLGGRDAELWACREW